MNFWIVAWSVLAVWNGTLGAMALEQGRWGWGIVSTAFALWCMFRAQRTYTQRQGKK